MGGDLGAIITSSAERAPWGWGLLATVIVALFRLRPLMAKIANEREVTLLQERAADMSVLRREVADLKEEIKTLEAAHTAALKEKDEEARRERDFAAAMERHLVHRINNVNACFDSMMMLMKNGVPTDEIVVQIEAKRKDQLDRENEERSKLLATKAART